MSHTAHESTGRLDLGWPPMGGLVELGAAGCLDMEPAGGAEKQVARSGSTRRGRLGSVIGDHTVENYLPFIE